MIHLLIYIVILKILINFRFVASIQRENFPEYVVSRWPQPGHTIVLISPLTMINLLPCDLHYSIKEANVRGHIKPGMSAAIHEVISLRFISSL